TGRVFGGVWPDVRVSEIGGVVAAIPRHAADPQQAWPLRARSALPGPVPIYATFIALLLPMLVASALLVTRLRPGRTGRRPARWARPHDLRPLRVRGRERGRLILGRADGHLVAAEPRQSVIVVGPTQTGKTTGFAIPAILEWQGPVVATSVKTDLL